jgi:hypothetical protein
MYGRASLIAPGVIMHGRDSGTVGWRLAATGNARDMPTPDLCGKPRGGPGSVTGCDQHAGRPTPRSGTSSVRWQRISSESRTSNIAWLNTRNRSNVTGAITRPDDLVLHLP